MKLRFQINKFIRKICRRYINISIYLRFILNFYVCHYLYRHLVLGIFRGSIDFCLVYSMYNAERVVKC